MNDLDLEDMSKAALIAMIESMYTEEQKTEAYDQGYDAGCEYEDPDTTNVDDEEYRDLQTSSETLDSIKDILGEIKITKIKVNCCEDRSKPYYKQELERLYEQLEDAV